jgi:anti-anti-sigma factor
LTAIRASAKNGSVAQPIIVRLQGEYDIARRDELDNLLDRYGDAEPLAFDLNDVRSIDTSAIRSLVRFQRARKEAGRTPLVLLKPSPVVRDFIEKAQLDHTFEVRDDY